MELDISKITDHLYIAASPTKLHREELLGLNIALIINMIMQRKHDKELTEEPFRVVWVKAIDSPFTPLPINSMIKASNQAIKEIDKGRAVLVFCKQGVHRSPAMAAAVLIRQGYTTDEAIQLIKSKRSVAAPDEWYIKPRLLKIENKINKELKS